MSDTIAKTCGNCRHADIAPPRMSKHRVPRVLQERYGKCVYPTVKLPMVSNFGDYRSVIWAQSDATRCPCWEAKPDVAPNRH